MAYYAHMVNVGKTKIVAITAIVAILVIGIVWLSVSQTEKTIKIGFIGPLTGDGASYGTPISFAVNIATEVVNQSGGINGKSIEVIYEDGKCGEGDAAQQAAERLIKEGKVKVIIGGTCSGETLAILPITEKEKIITFSPSSSSPDLTGVGKYFFRNTPSDTQAAEKLAQLIVEEYNHTKIAMISEETEYAQAFARVFRESIEGVGGGIITAENFAPEADDFRSILTKIKESDIDALFVNPQTEVAGGTIIKQAKEVGITAQLFGSNVLTGSHAIETAGENIEGLILVDGPGLSYGNTKAAAFLNEFRAEYGDPGIEFYAGAAYDAVLILTEAIKEVGMNTDKIREYLHTEEGFNGIAGTYRFNQNGDPEGIEFIIKEITKGVVVNM